MPGSKTSCSCAITIALLAFVGCGGSSPPSPPLVARHAPLISIFEAPEQEFSDPGPTFQFLRRLGVDVVRVEVLWDVLAPDPTSAVPPPRFDAADPASYPAAGWARYDAIVRAARASGIQVYMTLGPPPPLWAASRGAPAKSGPLAADWRPSAADYGAFVRAVATRYSGAYVPPGETAALPRVSFWSLWNEPNYGQYLAPQTIDQGTVEVSPMSYRGLLNAGWRALAQTGHESDTILIGEIAPRGLVGGNLPGDFGGMVPLRFVRALYCVDGSLNPLRGTAAAVRGCPTDAAGSAAFARANPALFEATGFAVHPYPQGLAPDVATTGVLGSQDYADLPQLPKLERLLDRVADLYGSARRLPLYSTEYGYKTNPPFSGGVPPDTAAFYLNWAEYLSWSDPRIRAFDQYLLVDPPPNSGSSFVTGLYYADGTPKPSFYAYRMPLFLPVSSASSGQPLVVWGCVRPARFARLQTGRPQIVQIQFRGSRQSSFRTLRRVPVTAYGYFEALEKFPGSGSVRLRWSYPDGTTIFSRTAPVTIR